MASGRKAWPVAVFSVGEAAAGTMLWRAHGQLHVTVVVKATFSLVDHTRMRRVAPRPLVVADVHHGGDARRSVKVPNDMAPYREHTDVVLYGSAYAPSGGASRTASVRLALHRGNDPLFDKTVYVYGERTSWRSEPQPFSRIPLDYEHAFGGAANPENPVGVGAGADAVIPNVIDAKRPMAPAGLGAIAPTWGVRAKRAPSDMPARSAARILEIPDTMDWEYFQVAPPDQRVSHLRGDEWLSLAGVSPENDTIQSRLPNVTAEARVFARAYQSGDAGYPIALHADLLVVDADASICTVTWRGSFPITGEDVAPALKVGAGVKLGDGALDWRSRSTHQMPAIAVPGDAREILTLDDSHKVTLRTLLPDDEENGGSEAETLQTKAARTEARSSTTTDELDEAEDETRDMVFDPSLSMSGDMPWEQPGAPVAAAPPPTTVDSDVESGETGTVDIEQLRALHGGALPWEASPDSTAESSPGPELAAPPHLLDAWRRPGPTITEEMDIDDLTGGDGDHTITGDGPLATNAPFPLAPAHKAPALLGPAIVPGAPWTHTPARRVVRPTMNEVTQTVDIDQMRAELGIDRARAESSPWAREARRKRTSTTVPQLNPTHLSMLSSGWRLQPPGAVLTVIAKATCDLCDGAPATLRDEPDLPLSDVFEGDVTRASLRYASDYAVKKQRADVTVVGHAHALGGPTEQMEVSFQFGHPDRRLSRRMVVFSDRAWGAKPLGPWSRMPLVWERSLGGPASADNPVGRGLDGATLADDERGIDGSQLMPNLQNPLQLVQRRTDRPPPICFAPISPSWPVRAALMGTFDETWAKTRAPHLPADLDLAFFQAAPREQQIDFPSGDEPFTLVGMHPTRATLSGRLPGIRARCFAKLTDEAGGAFREIPMNLDTVAFDMDDEVVHLVWRGVTDVATEEAWEIERLFLQTEALNEPPMSLEEAHRAYTSAELAFHAYAASAVGAPPAAPGAGALAAVTAAVAMARDLALPPLPEATHTTRDQVSAHLAANRPLSELSLTGADLSGMDLSSAKLGGAVLLRASLVGTNLGGADLNGAQLGEADLTDANLHGADLRLCDLSHAKLSRAVLEKTRLDNANFSGATGEDTSFEDAHGKLVSFAGAELTRARFDGASLDIPDFSGAVLLESSLCRAQIVQGRLFDTQAERARFEGATLIDASVVGANLAGSVLRGLDAPESVWERANLEGCDFTAANLAGASLAGATCTASIFRGADMRGVQLRKAKLARAILTGADLMEATFEQTDLTRADLREANLYGTSGWGTVLKDTQLQGAIIESSAVFKPSDS